VWLELGLGLLLNLVRDGLGFNDWAGVGIWLSDGPWARWVWTWGLWPGSSGLGNPGPKRLGA